ncbi:MAG: hypothetical protein R3E48_15975 [Burkholderiaceae bacterium]
MAIDPPGFDRIVNALAAELAQWLLAALPPRLRTANTTHHTRIGETP